MSDALQLIHAGRNCSIFLEERAGEKRALKLINSDLPRPEHLAQLKNEFKICRGLSLPNCREVYEEVVVNGRAGLSMAYIEGAPLKTHMADEAPGIPGIIGLAIRIIKAVDRLHRENIIHKDINSSNILISSTDGDIRIIDFGLSTRTRMKTGQLGYPDTLEGTLKYISPEQTGRMDRAVDFRTDYYSYGVMLYEMFTRTLPFESDDPVKLVYSHIAALPRPPHDICPAMGENLSGIILKLMSKNAEDRYQSAAGIISDLESCIPETGRTTGLVPGRNDLNDLFLIPETLYGRTAEQEILLAGFDRVCESGCEMTLVTGYSGVGKTSLVYQILRAVTRRNAYFVSGKYDQYQKNVPYSALIQAIEAYVEYLLTEPEERFHAHRERILGAVGKNGNVLMDLVPDIQRIIGSQPVVPVLGARENENRVRRVFRKFIQAISRPDHPLVIFLDDLQWIDLSSLEFLKLLLDSPVRSHLYLIGAFRENEVGPAHPLQQFLEETDSNGINRVCLDNLAEPHVHKLISHTLSAHPDQVAPLADTVYRKTHGNPFYTRVLLASIHRDGLLVYSYSERQWIWDITAIEQKGYSQNVVDLLCQRINELDENTRHTLRMAACIGSPFDINLLSVICAKSVEETVERLWPAVSAGIVEFMDTGYKLAGIEKKIRSFARFAHDRLQQAALAALPLEKREKIHVEIGRLLLADAADPGKHLFMIVDQLNQGITHIPVPDKARVARLNLDAGIRAKSSAAYDAAAGYFENGLALLGADRWSTQYHLSLGLYTHGAEAACLKGSFNTMAQYGEEVMAHAAGLSDRMKIHRIRIDSLIARGQWLPAVDEVIRALGMLGISIPAPGALDEERIEKRLAKTADLLEGKPPESLVELPGMTDPSMLDAMDILTAALPAAYIAAPALFPIIVSHMIDLSVRYGNAPMAPLAYANYGIVLCGSARDTGLAYRYGQLALDLLEHLEADAFQTRTINNVNVFLIHWQNHLKETLPPLMQAYRIGLETGDLVFAGYSINARNYHAFFTGAPLESLETEIGLYSGELLEIAQQGTHCWTRIHWQAIRNLMIPDDSPAPWQLNGEVFDEDRMRPTHEQTHDMVGLFYMDLYKLLLCVLFNEPQKAVAFGRSARKYLAGAAGMPLGPIFHFYTALARSAWYPFAPDAGTRDKLLEQISSVVQQLYGWAESGPENYLHKYYLVLAEKQRLLKRHGQAREYYDRAAALARDQGYTNEEALANELAGRYYLEREMFQQARFYLGRALLAYETWGAAAKTGHMQKVYGALLGTGDQQGAVPMYEYSATGSETNDLIDFRTILDASQAISREIVLDHLLKTLMEIVLTNSGADRGFFLSVAENRYFAESMDVLEAGVIRHLAVEGRTVPLPHSIIRYVQRSGETVLLNRADQDTAYSADPYFTDHHPRSLLCLPILRQSRISGMLYLENSVSSDVFTDRRVNILDTLSAQIAISIENARIHKTLEDRVRARTRKLEDMTVELKAANQKLEKLASEDPLTGLYNRRQFYFAGEMLIKDAIRSRTPVGVIMMDIDFFKKYNDTYGHQAGDRCLVQVAGVIKRLFQRGNDIVARYGGEEFVGIVFDMDPHNMQQVAATLCKEVAGLRISHNASAVSDVVTLSVGSMTTVPEEKTLLDDLVKAADNALYTAKENGRNQSVNL